MNRMLRIAAIALATASLHAAAAEPWPSRTITVVAPGAAGGTSDMFARLLADGLSKELGRAVIVENRDGVGTLLGSKAVAGAKPDGYTLLVGAAALTISPHVYKTIQLDPTIINAADSASTSRPMLPSSWPRRMVWSHRCTMRSWKRRNSGQMSSRTAVLHSSTSRAYSGSVSTEVANAMAWLSSARGAFAPER